MNWENEYNVYLFKYNVYDSNWFFIAQPELPSSGFTSLYAVTKETAEAIKTGGSTAGFKGIVWSSHLVMDFDDEEAAVEARGRLTRLGIAYEEYYTGNRGAHFYIPRPHAPSHLLPQLDKEWVTENFSKADLSIYSSLHMFRLSGTKHEKTGEIKTLRNVFLGESLILPNTIEDRIESIKVTYKDDYEGDESIFVDPFIMSRTVPEDEGKRHATLISLGILLKSRGESLEFIARWLYHSNLLYTPPLPIGDLERIVAFIDGASVEENI